MKKIDRKDFLKIAGGAIAGSAVGTVFSGAPFISLQWLVEWTQDQHVPSSGLEKYLKGVCEICPNKCSISVRMIGERAVKVETSNSGCPFGQTSLQMLYHPDRITTPLKNTGSKGRAKFTPVTWDEAIKDISSKINGIIKSGKNDRIASINKERNLSSELLDRMVNSIGSNHSYYEPTLDTLTAGAVGGMLDYNFDDADFILSFGARLLEGWGDSASISKSFSRWKERKVKFIQVDSVCTRTASAADEWVPIKPGTEIFVALGIANHLIKKKGMGSGAADFGAWSAIAGEYTPEAASRLTGVPAKKIEELADALSRAKSPVAVAGKGGKAISSSSAEIIAVYGLNTIVKSRSVTTKQNVNFAGAAPIQTAAKFLAESKKCAGFDEFVKTKNFDMLIVNGADPVYKSVYGKELAAKLEKSFVVAIMPLVNDTAAYADYVLPSITSFESKTAAGDPVVKPVDGAIHAGDAVLRIAKMVEGLQQSFQWKSYTDLIALTGKTAGAAGFSFKGDILKKQLADLKKALGDANYSLSLVPIEAPVVGDGDGLAFPYAMKVLGSETFSSGKLYVQINRETAKKHGICNNESLKIITEKGKVGSVKALLTDSVSPDTVAVPMGFGHKFYTRYAEDKGVNPREIMNDKIDPLTGTASWLVTRVKLS
ncbi:MAG: molybdopterin-dependent oxidoreductase [Spirochaetes bacterium]|jgi:anaerobic selenocysteine-containing dehydrogenase|nr:molybdopterin-dependent oxidoreductase [Spirochaetota bacterium]